jgi:hypothetical protein
MHAATGKMVELGRAGSRDYMNQQFCIKQMVGIRFYFRLQLDFQRHCIFCQKIW